MKEQRAKSSAPLPRGRPITTEKLAELREKRYQDSRNIEIEADQGKQALDPVMNVLF